MLKTVMKCSVTSTDELLALIDQVRGHFIVAYKLLKAQKVQTTGTQTVKQKIHVFIKYPRLVQSVLVTINALGGALIPPEVGGDAEDQDQHGVVDVEAVSNEIENTHRTHDLEKK